MSTIFDSHCHPQMEQYDNDREEVLGRAREAGIRLICVGTDLETSKHGIELAQKNDGMWATVGAHPNDIFEELRISDYELLLKKDKVVAIGEVGLDYYRTPEPEKQEQQKETLKQFISLAIKHKKPLILHCRDASKGTTGKSHQDLLEILNTYYLIHNTNLCGVAHSFTGSIDDTKKYLELGFYLGFNGIITFPSSRKATKDTVPGMYDEVVKYVPLENILLETDAPFLAPEPYRGKRNEPTYVIEVAKRISEIKSESIDRVIGQTTENCQRLFNLV